MGCILSVCGFPEKVTGEQHVVLRTSDSLTLLVKGKDRVKIVPLKKSLELVIVDRKNSKGDIRPDPMLVQQVEPQIERPREHSR